MGIKITKKKKKKSAKYERKKKTAVFCYQKCRTPQKKKSD
jgi:hypothetical protein